MKQIAQICEETPSTEYLVEVRDPDLDEIGVAQAISGSSQNFYACDTHFAPGSEARQNLTAAHSEVTRIVGADLSFFEASTTHRTESELFTGTPDGNYIDEIDDAAGAHPCPHGSSECYDMEGVNGWTLTTLRNGGGPVRFWCVNALVSNFVIGHNGLCTDTPGRSAFLHEFMHVAGMSHTDEWRSEDKGLLSVMQGSHIYLTALDVHYLREAYPEAGAANPHVNYVAGVECRFPNGDGTFDSPSSFPNGPIFQVMKNGELRTTVGRDSVSFYPTGYASWFNTGDQDADPGLCVVNQFLLREIGTETEIELKTWKIAPMPHLSQDQWKGTIQADKEEVAKLKDGVNYELVFRVNAWRSQKELTYDDNEVSTPVLVTFER